VVLFVAFWMYMIGATRSTRNKTMIVADVINILCKNERVTDVISMIEKVLTLALNLLFFSWAFRYILFSMRLGAVTSVLKIPFYIVHWSVVVGLGMMMIYNMIHLVDRFLTLKRKYTRKAPEIIEGGDNECQH